MRLTCVLIIFAICSVFSGAAAAPLPTPTILYVPAGANLASLNLKNVGTTVEHYHLSAKKWAQNPFGDLDLQTTSDITIDTAEVTLPPGKSTTLHISIRNPNVTRGNQGLYRIVFLIEPNAASANQNEHVQMRVGQVDMPVFVGGSITLEGSPQLQASMITGYLTFSLKNSFDSAIRPPKVALTGLTDRGKVIFTAARLGWYILPKSTIQYELAISKEDCLAIHDVKIDTGNAALTVPVNHSLCGPGNVTSFYRSDLRSLVSPMADHPLLKPIT